MQKDKTNYKKFLLVIALVLGGIILFATLSSFGNFALLNPKGTIASQQKTIIITAVSLMLVGVAPILGFAFFVAWKYRADKRSRYEPEFDGSKPLQLGWLGVLCLIIFALAVIAWQGAHKLDPRQPLQSGAKPITVQAVALQWKWLFIYPELGISTLNFVTFPEDTPIVFEITADAPMNSLWIPELGGQMYAMNGMRTKLHLMADQPGTFSGRSSNISGAGFAGMDFEVKATTSEEFNHWLQAVENSQNKLTRAVYDELAKPSEGDKPVYFAETEDDLFNSIIMKYMAPAGHAPTVHGLNHYR